jgi:transposase
MDDRTTLLFTLPDFRVLDVTREPDGGRRVLVESVAEQGGCPACGVLSGLIKDRPTSRIKDLPHGLVPLRVFVRKRRFACAEPLCDVSASRSPRRPRSSRRARGSRAG